MRKDLESGISTTLPRTAILEKRRMPTFEKVGDPYGRGIGKWNQPLPVSAARRRPTHSLGKSDRAASVSGAANPEKKVPAPAATRASTRSEIAIREPYHTDSAMERRGARIYRRWRERLEAAQSPAEVWALWGWFADHALFCDARTFRGIRAAADGREVGQ